MGLLDRVKGLVEQAGSLTSSSSPASGTPPTPSAPASAVPDGAPVTPTDLSTLLGAAVQFDDAGADDTTRWWRFTTTAPGGPATVEVHEATEAAMARHGGDPAALAAERLGGCDDRGVLAAAGLDGSAWGRPSGGRVEAWAWLADSCFGVVVDGPSDDGLGTAERVLGAVYRLG